MIITKAALEALRTGFNLSFKTGIGTVEPKYKAFTTPVGSTTKVETYGFLKEWPIFREWIGEKRIKSIEEMVYILTNKNYETTIGIHKTKIEDDNLGLYPAMFEGWGQEAAALPDRLSFEALRDGHLRPCFDNQNFFDTAHPVKDGVASNMSAAGGQQPWFILDTSKSLKPVIIQERKKPEFRMVTDPEDSHVFKTGEYLAGGEARGAAGYTFWQLAYRSTKPLNEANYNEAKAAMAALTNDEGEPLGVRPTLGIFGVSNQAAARKLFQAANLAGGKSNTLLNDIVVLEADRLL